MEHVAEFLAPAGRRPARQVELGDERVTRSFAGGVTQGFVNRTRRQISDRSTPLGSAIYDLGGTIHRKTVDVRSRDATRMVWLGDQSPMSKSCETIRAPGRSSRKSFGRNR